VGSMNDFIREHKGSNFHSWLCHSWKCLILCSLRGVVSQSYSKTNNYPLCIFLSKWLNVCWADWIGSGLIVNFPMFWTVCISVRDNSIWSFVKYLDNQSVLVLDAYAFENLWQCVFKWMFSYFVCYMLPKFNHKVSVIKWTLYRLCSIADI